MRKCISLCCIDCLSLTSQSPIFTEHTLREEPSQINVMLLAAKMSAVCTVYKSDWRPLVATVA